MRVLLAGLFHETHCFVPDKTTLADFRIDNGDEILARRGDGSQIDGFLNVAEEHGWTVVPTTAYLAMPSGLVARDVYESFWRDFERHARVAADVDAVFLSLHGAMITETEADPEGDFLGRLRAIRGLETAPIFGAFDLHANFTAAMAEGANGLVCYRENPHIDAFQTGERAARLLARAASSGVVPRMINVNAGIIWPPGGTGTANRPMRELEALAREIEVAFPDIWAVNVVAGFSFADCPDPGVSFSVVTVGDDATARAALRRLVDLAWTLRAEGLVVERTPDAVLKEILPIEKGPVVFAEPSDNIGGGASGDGTGLLRAFLRNGVDNAAVVIADAEAVRTLDGAVPGAVVALSIGGRHNPFDEGPLAVAAQFISRSDGHFELEDIHSHLAASYGRFIDMGPCAVVRSEGVTILLTSRKTPPFDLGQLRSQGIIPERLSAIGVKAAVAHRRAYDPIAAASYSVSTPGPCLSDPRALPYRRLRRPVFPLDPDMRKADA
ncbi:MAG TPA: M81 family metallopeptidase [Bauldia sp.]|nr:M81 family metallopeptidase [Bauldia sp.]